MPIHLQKMIKNCFVYTLGFGLIAALLIACFWNPESKLLALGGLVWGMLVATIGFVMICYWASQLDATQTKNKGVLGYMGRYFFYAITLFLGAWLHLSVLCMLGGIMIQKLSVFVYALKENAVEKKGQDTGETTTSVLPLEKDQEKENVENFKEKKDPLT